MRARLIEAEDELHPLWHKRNDALQDLNTCKDQTCMWVSKADRWKAEAYPSTSHLAHSTHILITLHIFTQLTVDI